jgi:hypothetical protein
MLVSKLLFFLDFGFLVEGPKVFRVLIFFPVIMMMERMKLGAL